MWPAFDSRLVAICGLSLLLVLYCAPRGFSPGSPVYPCPQKPTFLNSNSIGCKTSLKTIIIIHSKFVFIIIKGERNLVLRSDLVEGLTQCYNSAGAKLESSKFHLIRAQTTAQVNLMRTSIY